MKKLTRVKHFFNKIDLHVLKLRENKIILVELCLNK